MCAGYIKFKCLGRWGVRATRFQQDLRAMSLPIVRFIEPGYFRTSDGYEIATHNKFDVLVAPESVLAPLSATSMRNAMRRSGDEASTLWISPGGPDAFDDRYPNVDPDVSLHLETSGDLAATVRTGRSQWEDGQDEWQADMARLFAGICRRNRCGPLRFDRDYWGDDETVAIHIPISPRGKTIGDLIRINHDAVALLKAMDGGGLTLERTVDLVRGGRAGALVDQQEGAWFDGKRAPYRLEDETQKWELAKDVASFANALGGGVIVLGAKTRAARDGDVVSEISDIDLTLIPMPSYRGIIMARVHPAIERLELLTVDHGGGRGVGLIHIPPQSDSRKPFLMRGAIVRNRVRTGFVSIPIRDGESTRYSDLTEIYGLLQAGRAILSQA